MQLTKDYKDHGDASEGPLKPGEVGVVIEINDSVTAFRVMTGEGEKWWYRLAAIYMLLVFEYFWFLVCVILLF